MATASSRFSSISTAYHGVSDWDWDEFLVLGIAHFAVYNGHNGLLENVGHTSWVTSLTPSCNVAFGSDWWVSGRQADGRNIFVELNWLLQLEHGDVVVEAS
jgi:hypothetical protein